MATLKQQLLDARKAAMRDGQNVQRDVIQLLLSEIKQAEVDTRAELSDEQVMDVVQREVKKRRESIAEIDEGVARGQLEEARAVPLRTDYEAELLVLEGFLPEQLSRERVEELAREAIAATGANTPKDLGRVMTELMPQVKGRADGKLVNEVVRGLLQG